MADQRVTDARRRLVKTAYEFARVVTQDGEGEDSELKQAACDYYEAREEARREREVTA